MLKMSAQGDVDGILFQADWTLLALGQLPGKLHSLVHFEADTAHCGLDANSF